MLFVVVKEMRRQAPVNSTDAVAIVHVYKEPAESHDQTSVGYESINNKDDSVNSMTNSAYFTGLRRGEVTPKGFNGSIQTFMEAKPSKRNASYSCVSASQHPLQILPHSTSGSQNSLVEAYLPHVYVLVEALIIHKHLFSNMQESPRNLPTW